MPRNVVLYSQPGCGACEQVARYLSNKGIPFTKRDVRDDPQALEELVRGGFRSTPVTMIDGRPVVGYDPQALDKMTEN